jgi:hypothetical protein
MRSAARHREHEWSAGHRVSLHSHLSAPAAYGCKRRSKVDAFPIRSRRPIRKLEPLASALEA